VWRDSWPGMLSPPVFMALYAGGGGSMMFSRVIRALQTSTGRRSEPDPEEHHIS
jgi:hypothetical protein